MTTANEEPSTSRAGLARVIPAWEYRHLRALAGLRMGGGVVLAACGVLTLAFGGNDSKTHRWAAAFFSAAVLSSAAGCWEWRVARSDTRRT